MNEFEMCKAIAELEGFEIVQQKTGGWFAATAHNKTVFDYNPITDLALNCELRDFSSALELCLDAHKLQELVLLGLRMCGNE